MVTLLVTLMRLINIGPS